MANCTHPPRSLAVDLNGYTFCADCGTQFFFRINRPRSGWGPSPLSFDLRDCGIVFNKIKCPFCWEEVEIPDVYVAAIESMQAVNFPCCKNVPVGGKNGILARVKRARMAG
jgi:hypothetical protein